MFASFAQKFVENVFISNKELGWPCRVGRVGGLLFRTHSEQRARASRGQLQSVGIQLENSVGKSGAKACNFG